MSWYAYQPLSNHFWGTIPPLPYEPPPFLFDLDDFEPGAVDQWKLRSVIIAKERGTKRGDFPATGRFPPILNARALEALRPLLAHCDILPLECDEEPLVAINPPLLANALDHEESVVDKWLDDGQFINITRRVFRGPRVPQEPIFRLVEERNLVIVSEEFREAVEKHKLKGLYFEPLDATWKP